ncbi:MAG: T9SS type A sorting domain-containing protein [Fluviicola sp.]|nr:T9SS type A sorting domain-containing protein [Fluviicola sp.]
MKLLYVLPFILFVHFTSFAQSYSGGSGTILNPYLIANKMDLKYLSENSGEWSKNFKQTANIYFTSVDFATGGDFYNNGNGFNPIGNFSGTYDGSGYLIDGLIINRPGADGVGLFGSAHGIGSIIQSLGLTNVNVIGHYSVGGLVGFAYDEMQVINCYVTGSITGTGYVGGLLGDIGGVTVDKCHADVTVSGTVGPTTGDIGGLIGIDLESFVYRSYSSGTVTASVQNGGFIGRAQSTTLIDNYSTATVNGGYMTGGFVGASDAAILQNCYATGLVPNTGTFIGGFAGYGNASSATNCFWDQETSGQTTSSFGTPKSSLQMKTASTFTNATWDFVGETVNGSNDYWKMGQCNNNGYPVFQWQQSENYPSMSFGSSSGNVMDSSIVCFNNSTLVSVNSWFDINWYDSITAGNSLATGSNFTSPQLTETTTYYAEVNDGPCVNPFRLAFTVVVNPENTMNQTLVFCSGSGSVTVGTNTYTTTGTYIDTLTAANGCDSIVTTNLTIQSPVNVTTSTNGLTISANANGATYQWINCSTNSAIAGETAQSFTATANGTYAVIVTDGSCSDTSACVTITTVGLTNLESSNLVVYPNPSTGIFVLEGLAIGSILEVTNPMGQLIFTTTATDFKTPIDLSNESNGIYFVKMNNYNLHKLIKQD